MRSLERIGAQLARRVRQRLLGCASVSLSRLRASGFAGAGRSPAASVRRRSRRPRLSPTFDDSVPSLEASAVVHALRLWKARAMMFVIGWFASRFGNTRGSSVITVRHGPREWPRMALTFDDSVPSPEASAVVRVLAEHRVRATVFVTGDYLRRGPNLAREIAAAGLEIGDHTRSHTPCRHLSWQDLLSEIGDGTETFRAMTGVQPAPLFRPPGGNTSRAVAKAAWVKGFCYQVLWDLSARDWDGRSADDIKRRVLGKARNGTIVLLHLSAPHTADALAGIIAGLRARGYELVTVSDLLRRDHRAVMTTGGAWVSE